MAYFRSTEQFYACAQALFDRVQVAYPRAADDVIKAKLILRFLCSNPTAVLLINGRHNPASFTFGETRIRPEVDITLETDTLHLVLLGDLGLSKAFSTKAMKVRGPARKTLALADLFHQLQFLYPQILREQGLE
jgi:hypothetical protein